MPRVVGQAISMSLKSKKWQIEMINEYGTTRCEHRTDCPQVAYIQTVKIKKWQHKQGIRQDVLLCQKYNPINELKALCE